MALHIHLISWLFVPPGLRADWDKAGRINVRMALEVVPLDMLHVSRDPEALLVVEVSQPPVDSRVALDSSQVCLEVDDVDGVEPDKAHEQTHVEVGRRFLG